ncbi:MAG: HesA/MoeB/ThiF family protein [Syntrophobacteraceae bacterium]|nr:HesA/MoeB/ThiF family protein [Syntrophobacteraceae bacterium]
MAATETSLTDQEKELYRCNLLLDRVGEDGQLRLKASRVLVIGAGGLGSPALLYLGAGGIGEIGIVDGDRVDLSNLQRQVVHGREDIGKKKTLSARETLHRLRPDLRVTLHTCRLTDSNAGEILAPYDFVIEATDNFESKFLVNDFCMRLNKPFSHAGVVGWYGQTMTVLPGKGPCFRCIFQQPPGETPGITTREMGVLGTVAGILGLIQATETLKYLLGAGNLLVGRLLTLDALSMTFREVKLPLDKRCRVCASCQMTQDNS